MAESTVLDGLVETWYSRWLLDEDTVPESLCSDHPELLSEFRRRIDEIKRLDQLVGEYECMRQAGTEPTPEQVCREHPELIQQFKAKIRKLRLFDDAFPPVDENEADTVDRVGQFCAGRYKIDGVLNRGGQGVIYKAQDTELGRVVVIKGPGRRWLGKQAHHYLEQEAYTIGRLEHPGIVPVYGFGKDEDEKPYYAMKFIDGETLGTAIDRFHRQTESAGNARWRSTEFQELLQKFVLVCQTIAYAHSRHVAHRDIKPSNIMLGKFGEVWVVDWGLAKQVEPMDGSCETTVELPRDCNSSSLKGAWLSQPGVIKGTPSYMSPEQAAGRNAEVGPASDIYSLGATLCELLTGGPPVRPDSDRGIPEIMLAVPKPLSAICSKAMQVESNQRYASAADLAADLNRWIADVPVSVMKEPWHERTRRWVNHHSRLVASFSAALLMAIVALAAIALLISKNNELLANAYKKLQDVTDAQSRELYRNQFLMAAATWRNNNARGAEEILEECDQSQRAIEWYLLRNLCRAPRDLIVRTPGPFNKIATNSQGTFLAVRGMAFPDSNPGLSPEPSSLVELMDLRTEKVVETFHADDFEFSPHGHLLAVELQDQHQIQLYNFKTMSLSFKFPGKAFAFSHDGQLLAVLSTKASLADETSGEITVWNTSSGTQVAQVACPGTVLKFAFRQSVDGLVVVFEKGPARGADAPTAALAHWDIESNEWVNEFEGPQLRIRSEIRSSETDSIIFSPDISFVRFPASLVTGERDVIVDAMTGKVLFNVPFDEPDNGSPNSLARYLRPWTRVRFSPDCQWVAGLNNSNQLSIWSTQNGDEKILLGDSLEHVLSFNFGPDSQVVVAAMSDQSICYFDLAAAGRCIARFPTGNSLIFDLHLHADERHLFGVGLECGVRVWNMTNVFGVILPEESGQSPTLMAVTHGGLAAGIQADGTKRVWSLTSLRQELKLSVDPTYLFHREVDIRFSGDGHRLATAVRNEVQLVDLRKGSISKRFSGVRGPLTFTSDSNFLVAVRQPNDPDRRGEPAANDWEGKSELVRLDVKTEKIAPRFPIDSEVISVCPVRRWIATANDTQISIFSAEPFFLGSQPNRVQMPLIKFDAAHLGKVDSLHFSPDGRWLASTAEFSKFVHLWNTADWRMKFELPGRDSFETRASEIQCLDISNDGRRLALVNTHEQIQIFDTQTGHRLWVSERFPGKINSLKFSLNGQQLVVCCGLASTRSGGKTFVLGLIDGN